MFCTLYLPKQSGLLECQKVRESEKVARFGTIARVNVSLALVGRTGCPREAEGRGEPAESSAEFRDSGRQSFNFIHSNTLEMLFHYLQDFFIQI